MTKAEAKKRIEKLKEVISHHRYLYHVLNKQEISDAVLDSLKHELFKLEQQYPEFITSDSPSQRVTGQALEGFEKVRHQVPMLSIEDVFSEEELKDWENYLKRITPGAKLDYFCEPKIDGFAVALIYKNGIFTTGATRGDGRVGEDVTQNLKTIESIPLRLRNLKSEILNPKQILSSKLKIPNNFEFRISNFEFPPTELEVRGEVYMTKQAFEKVNEERRKKGESFYANPRNLAAGSIRQLDPKLAASRPLEFLAYGLISDLGQKTHIDEHQILKALGFKTDAFAKPCPSLEEAVLLWRKIAKERTSLSYLIDGVVITVNDNDLFKKLGIVGKAPRGMRAFKFSPKQATTIIEDINLQIGRTGAVTPVAHLKPVPVGGVTVTRATLHNEEEIKKIGVKIGDTVIVERVGDVIPAVAKVLPELRTGKEKIFYFPKNCPVCLTKLSKPKGEAIWRCLNSNCVARKREFLRHFASKKAFDIEGLGPKIINQLMDENLISQPTDFFELEEGDLIPLEKFASKKAKNLVEAIQKRKKITLSKFIYALGIRNVGEETAELLARNFQPRPASLGGAGFSIFNFQNISLEQLQQIKDIGPVVARNIYNWFQDKRNLEFLEKLKKAGVEIESQKRMLDVRHPTDRIGAEIKEKTFVLTGSLETMARDEAKEKIRFLDGKISESVSKKTDYLVVGKEPGSAKMEKAQKLGIKIIDEKEFLRLIR